jgi:hypothetical protein
MHPHARANQAQHDLPHWYADAGRDGMRRLKSLDRESVETPHTKMMIFSPLSMSTENPSKVQIR